MTWTPATTQAEVWTSETRSGHVFSPLVFAAHPVFDTGQAGSYWPPKTIQAETWTPKAVP
jgi:hypothetical protein